MEWHVYAISWRNGSKVPIMHVAKHVLFHKQRWQVTIFESFVVQSLSFCMRQHVYTVYMEELICGRFDFSAVLCYVVLCLCTFMEWHLYAISWRNGSTKPIMHIAEHVHFHKQCWQVTIFESVIVWFLPLCMKRHMYTIYMEELFCGSQYVCCNTCQSVIIMMDICVVSILCCIMFLKLYITTCSCDWHETIL